MARSTSAARSRPPRRRTPPPAEAVRKAGPGVHFALAAEDEERLRALADDAARLRHLRDVIEPRYVAQQPGFVTRCGATWETIHRALAGGDAGPSRPDHPLDHAILGGASLCGGTDRVMSLKSREQVRDVAAALARVTPKDFCGRFLATGADARDAQRLEEELARCWKGFVAIRALFQFAALASRCVLFTAER